MDDALVDVVLGRVDGDGTLGQGARELVLAACRGDDALAAALAGDPAAAPERTGTSPVTTAAAARPDPFPGPAPARAEGAFLRSVTVAGFRGVGDEATLELEPGPGLTVVVGRNGSGKSSFAEGLEVLLTGTTDRFERQAVFRDGWRNLHRPSGARVAAELHLAGAAGTTTVERRWDDDAGLADGEASVQVAGGAQHEPLSALRPAGIGARPRRAGGGAGPARSRAPVPRGRGP